MNFTLTAQMVDKIAFAMEDQKEKFAVDVDTGELVAVSSLPALSEEKHVRLPRWGSAEGFHLMESFVTSLDNPAYREQLSRCLTMGKGVFRAFKDALKQNKEIEKLWFTYKERRLRGVIVSWYNANREARGLARLFGGLCTAGAAPFALWIIPPSVVQGEDRPAVPPRVAPVTLALAPRATEAQGLAYAPPA